MIPSISRPATMTRKSSAVRAATRSAGPSTVTSTWTRRRSALSTMPRSRGGSSSHRTPARPNARSGDRTRVARKEVRMTPSCSVADRHPLRTRSLCGPGLSQESAEHTTEASEKRRDGRLMRSACSSGGAGSAAVEQRPPVQAAAQGDEADQVARFRARAPARLVEGHRQRGRGRVAVLLDVVVDLVVGQARGASAPPR